MTCNWPVSYTGCADTTVLDQLTPEDRALVEDMAVQYLWNWTLRMFGQCPVTVRPCRSACLNGWTYWTGGWASWDRTHTPVMSIPSMCGCSESHACGPSAATVRLPGPVGSVQSVKVDGQLLDVTAYGLDSGGLLVRKDGGVWPTYQDLDRPDSEVGTWSVTYLYGAPVPAGGQVAAGVLARELALALCRSGSCELPQRVQTITRQGVTMAMLDPFDGLDDGKTGIWVIDSWVASVVRPRRPSGVWSPDVPRPRHRRTVG